MKRLLIALLSAAIALTACSSSKKVYTANGTTVTTDTSQKTVTVQSREGTMKMGKGVVDVASLGVPIYDGASQDEGALSVTGAKGSAQMAAFTTPDSFDKVYAFYKNKLPAGSEKMKVDEGDSSVAEFVTGGGKAGETQTMVMISKKGDKTSIVITKGNQQ
jgi:hypothetical protein